MSSINNVTLVCLQRYETNHLRVCVYSCGVIRRRSAQYLRLDKTSSKCNPQYGFKLIALLLKGTESVAQWRLFYSDSNFVKISENCSAGHLVTWMVLYTKSHHKAFLTAVELNMRVRSHFPIFLLRSTWRMSLSLKVLSLTLRIWYGVLLRPILSGILITIPTWWYFKLVTFLFSYACHIIYLRRLEAGALSLKKHLAHVCKISESRLVWHLLNSFGFQ